MREKKSETKSFILKDTHYSIIYNGKDMETIQIF